MELMWSPLSPYARKVMILAHELGLAERITCVRPAVKVTEPNAELMRLNPLNKIPTLVLDDGRAIFDSAVICDYLDALSDRRLTGEGDGRWDVATRQALGDGVIDLLISWQFERIREPAMRSQPHLDAYAVKAKLAFDRLEDDAIRLGKRFDVGRIATGCALAYADYRFDALAWRDGRPALAAWYAGFEQRASVVANPYVTAVAA